MSDTRNFLCSKLEIGATAQIAAVGDKLRLPCSVVGAYLNQRLILSRPTEAAFRKVGIFPDDYLKIDRPILVQAVSSGYVFAFKSNLSGIYNTSCKILIVDLPHEISYQSLRKQARVPCAFPTRILIDGEAVSAIMLDISQGGGRLQVNAAGLSKLQPQINSGEAGSIEVRYPNQDQFESIPCKFSNLKAVDTDLYEFSALFETTPDGAKRYLDYAQMASEEIPEDTQQQASG